MVLSRIRTELASIKAISNDGVIVSLQSQEKALNYCFGSLSELKEAIDLKKLTVKKWAISVPQNYCIFKTLDLPTNNPAEALQMLEFEMPSIIPIPVEDLVYGFTQLNSNSDYLRVSVCVIKKKILDEVLQDIRTIGIKPSKVISESAAIEAWFCKKASKQHSHYDLNILIDKKTVKVYNSLNLTSYEPFEKYKRESLKQIIIDFEHDNKLFDLSNEPVSIGIVTREEDISELNDLETADNLSGYKYDIFKYPQVHHPRDGKEDHSVQFLYDSIIAEGTLYSFDVPNLKYCNLIPREIIKKEYIKKRLLNYSITSGIIVLFVISIWLNFVASNLRMIRACNKIKSEITPIKHVATVTESKKHILRAMRNQYYGRELIMQILADLYKYSPKNVSISNLKFSCSSGGASLNFRGQTDYFPDALDYSEAMKKSKFLKDIQVDGAQQIKKPGGSIVEFKAECIVRED